MAGKKSKIGKTVCAVSAAVVACVLLSQTWDLPHYLRAAVPVPADPESMVASFAVVSLKLSK